MHEDNKNKDSKDCNLPKDSFSKLEANQIFKPNKLLHQTTPNKGIKSHLATINPSIQNEVFIDT